MNFAYFLGIDQGTTGSTSLVIRANEDGDESIIGSYTSEFKQYYPQSDWVEHDLLDIWHSVENSCEKALKIAEETHGDFSRNKLCAIGITNQRETIGIYERKNLRPLRRAIVWQCKRSTKICKTLKEEGFEKEVNTKTGLYLDPYFSGTKIRWIIENEPQIANKIHSGEALIGTMDSYLIAKLSGGKEHLTEPSNASRTLLYNIEQGKWDQSLVELMGLSNTKSLAQIKDSSTLLATTKGLNFLADGIPITAALGDQQAALAGQRCFLEGETKCTYGTGAFALTNTAQTIKRSKNGLLTTVAWQIKGQRSYALEGSSFIAGAAIQFLRDNLSFLKDSAESEILAKNVKAAPDIYFVPALVGLGTPWWQPEVKGAFLGLTRSTTKAELTRAALEGIALQVEDLLASISLDLNSAISALRVDGGASQNNLLLKLQANFSQISIEKPKYLETTALGAALFAGLGSKFYNSLENLRKNKEDALIVRPDIEKNQLRKIKSGWKRAIGASINFAPKAN